MQKHEYRTSPVDRQQPDPQTTPAKMTGIFQRVLPFAWLPIPLLLTGVAIIGLAGFDRPITLPLLVQPLTVVFGILVPAWIAVLAGRGFLRFKTAPPLLFASGLLLLAIAHLFASVAYNQFGELHAALIIFVTAMGLGGGAHLLGVVAALIASNWTAPRPSLVLAGAIAGIIFITASSTYFTFGILSLPFVTETAEVNVLLRSLLIPAVFLSACASVMLVLLARRQGWVFGRWYGLALGLVTIEMIGFAFSPDLTSAMSWVGRTAQYLGGFYLLAGMFHAGRDGDHWKRATFSALRESEERFRALAETTREGIAICQNGRIKHTNEQFQRLLGYPATDLMNTPIRALVPEDRANQILGGLLSEGETAMEHPMIRKNGTHIMVESYGRTIAWDSENKQLWALRDITSRKRHERALRESEEGFRTLFENMTEGVGVGEPIFDEKGDPCDLRFLKTNRAFHQHTGIVEDVVGKPLKTVLPQLEESWIQRHSRVALTGQPVRYEEFNRDTDRYYRVACYSPAEGKFAVLFSDITQDKRDQEILRRITEEKERNLAKSKAILQQMSEALVVLDPWGNVTDQNQAALRMFGFTDVQDAREQVADLTAAFKLFEVSDLEGKPLPPDDWPLSRMLRGESFQSYILRIRRMDTGKEWIASIGGAPVYDEEGEMLAAIMTMRDFTERYEMEQALVRSRDELEERVRERTSELQRRADQLARLTSELTLTEQRERKRLAQHLHDHLQQLLVGARFGLHLLRQKVPDEHKQAIQGVDDIMNESIEASRSLTMELSPPILHEAGLAEGLKWLARWEKSKHDLTVDLQLDPTVTVEREDVRLLVFQAIRELLLNVVKHAGTKEVRLELTRENSTLRALVDDKGAGFETATVLEKGPENLTGGFGLFSIRERFELIGGKIEIESAPGKGSRFTLIAPLLESLGPTETAPAEPSAAPPEKTEATGGDRSKIRLVLVDDHAVVRQGLSVLLKSQEDVEIVGEAADGATAIARARQLRPDVILMDFSLPGINGVEATRIIHQEMPDVSIIGLSMYEDADRARAMREAGAVAYLCKSGKAEELVRTIRRVADHGAAPTRSW